MLMEPIILHSLCARMNEYRYFDRINSFLDDIYIYIYMGAFSLVYRISLHCFLLIWSIIKLTLNTITNIVFNNKEKKTMHII